MVATVLSAQGHNKYCISFPLHLGKLRPSEFKQELSGHGPHLLVSFKAASGFQGPRTKACPLSQLMTKLWGQKAGAPKHPIPINRTDTLKPSVC